MTTLETTLEQGQEQHLISIAQQAKLRLLIEEAEASSLEEWFDIEQEIGKIFNE